MQCVIVKSTMLSIPIERKLIIFTNECSELVQRIRNAFGFVYFIKLVLVAVSSLRSRVR